MRILNLFAVVLLAGFYNFTKAGDNVGEAKNPDLLYIGKSDTSGCVKYICIDSSGFYYLYCDSIIDGKQRQKRIELDKYTEESTFLYSLDTSAFSSSSASLKASGCGLSKGNLSVYAETDHKPYKSSIPIVIDCNTNSPHYKFQLINEFFEKIDRDIQLQSILTLLPYYIMYNDTSEDVVACDSGYYQFLSDEIVLRIGASVITGTKSKVVIDSTSDIELIFFRKGKASLANFCSNGLYLYASHPVKRMKVKSGLLDGVIVEKGYYMGKETDLTTILINRLEFPDKETRTKHLYMEALFYKVVKKNDL